MRSKFLTVEITVDGEPCEFDVEMNLCVEFGEYYLECDSWELIANFSPNDTQKAEIKRAIGLWLDENAMQFAEDIEANELERAYDRWKDR